MTNTGVSDPLTELPFRATSARAELRAFRSFRMGRVLAGAIIGTVQAEHCLFIHVLPLGGVEDSLPIASKLDQLRALAHPIGASGWDERFNADGYLLYNGDRHDGRITAYVQWLRCGGIEIFAGNLVTDPDNRSTSRVPVLYSGPVVECLNTDLPKAVDGIRICLGTERVLAISGVWSGLKGVHIAQPASPVPSHLPIDRDFVATPWVAIEPKSDPASAIGAMGDVLWQSAGLPTMPRAATRS